MEYKLKVLYKTSNKYETKQYEKVIVKADSFRIEGGCFKFFKRVSPILKLICAYPLNNTIIESINELES